jgi:hypothetical protein
MLRAIALVEAAMLSMVLLAVLFAVGTIVAGNLWWKTRALLRQARAFGDDGRTIDVEMAHKDASETRFRNADVTGIWSGQAFRVIFRMRLRRRGRSRRPNSLTQRKLCLNFNQSCGQRSVVVHFMSPCLPVWGACADTQGLPSTEIRLFAKALPFSRASLRRL